MMAIDYLKLSPQGVLYVWDQWKRMATRKLPRGKPRFRQLKETPYYFGEAIVY